MLSKIRLPSPEDAGDFKRDIKEQEPRSDAAKDKSESKASSELCEIKVDKPVSIYGSASSSPMIFSKEAVEVKSDNAELVANLILNNAPHANIQKLIELNPDLLKRRIEVKDHCNRRILATPYQLALGAVDVNGVYSLMQYYKPDQIKGLSEVLKILLLSYHGEDEVTKQQTQQLPIDWESKALQKQAANEIAFAKACSDIQTRAYATEDIFNFLNACKPILIGFIDHITPKPDEVITTGLHFQFPNVVGVLSAIDHCRSLPIDYPQDPFPYSRDRSKDEFKCHPNAAMMPLICTLIEFMKFLLPACNKPIHEKWVGKLHYPEKFETSDYLNFIFEKTHEKIASPYLFLQSGEMLGFGPQGCNSLFTNFCSQKETQLRNLITPSVEKTRQNCLVM